MNWEDATQEELLQYALEEGDAFVKTPRSSLKRLEWEFVPDFPVERFLKGTMPSSYLTPKSWIRWFNSECNDADDGGERFKGLEKAWVKDPSSVVPIIAVELEDGRIDIGDGYHRAAISIKHKMRTAPVVLGRKRGRRKKTEVKYKGATYVLL